MLLIIVSLHINFNFSIILRFLRILLINFRGYLLVFSEFLSHANFIWFSDWLINLSGFELVFSHRLLFKHDFLLLSFQHSDLSPLCIFHQPVIALLLLLFSEFLITCALQILCIFILALGFLEHTYGLLAALLVTYKSVVDLNAIFLLKFLLLWGLQQHWDYCWFLMLITRIKMVS